MKLLLVLLCMLVPSMAWAHPGHGGVGLFHHLLDLAPAVILVALIAWAGIWAKIENNPIFNELMDPAEDLSS